MPVTGFRPADLRVSLQVPGEPSHHDGTYFWNLQNQTPEFVPTPGKFLLWTHNSAHGKERGTQRSWGCFSAPATSHPVLVDPGDWGGV